MGAPAGGRHGGRDGTRGPEIALSKRILHFTARYRDRGAPSAPERAANLKTALTAPELVARSHQQWQAWRTASAPPSVHGTQQRRTTKRCERSASRCVPLSPLAALGVSVTGATIALTHPPTPSVAPAGGAGRGRWGGSGRQRRRSVGPAAAAGPAAGSSSRRRHRPAGAGHGRCGCAGGRRAASSSAPRRRFRASARAGQHLHVSRGT